ncbi:MAG: HAD family hydrolase [Mycoplasma sp.]
MIKKLFVFDFDGTLLNDDRKMLPSTIKTLNKVLDLGHEVAICTGRNLFQLSEYLPLVPKLNIVSTMNGSVIDIIDTKETIMIAEPINKEVFNDLLRLAQEYKRELQWSNSNEFYRVYFGTTPEQDIDRNDHFFNMGTINPKYDSWEDVQKNIEMPILHAALKMESTKINAPFDYMYDKYVKTNICSVVKTGDVYIDVNGLNINKFNAVKKIQSISNVSNENTYCFGDSDNDISMLSQAGHGVCMGNGTKMAKENSQYLIGGNNSDAISEFIEKILGENSYE